MRLTKEREETIRKIHTDNRYGVLELLEEIRFLKEDAENTDIVMSKVLEERERIIDKKNRLMIVIEAAKELRDSKFGREYKKACENFDKVYEELEKK